MNRVSGAPIGASIGAMLVAIFTAEAAWSVPADENYPSRPIRIVVPFSAGTAVDVIPRIVGKKLAARWQQPIVIENRPGASGNIGADIVAHARPDGYTLLGTPPGPLILNERLMASMPFDPHAFVPVSIIAAVPNVLVVHPRLSIATIDEFVAYAKAHPGKLNLASPGNGTTPHLSGEWLRSLAGIDIVHVAYKGGAPALNDLLAGQVDAMFANLGDAMPHIRAGKLRLIAVGSSGRSSEFPDIASIAERYPGFASIAWYSVVAPPGTPESIVARLSSAIDDVLRDPDIAKAFRDMFATPIGGTPQRTAAFIRDEAERWGRVINASGVRVEQ